MAPLLHPLSTGAAALGSRRRRAANIAYASYLWLPWKCEFLPPPRAHTITPLARSHIRLGATSAHALLITAKYSEVTANRPGSAAQYVCGRIFSSQTISGGESSLRKFAEFALAYLFFCFCARQSRGWFFFMCSQVMLQLIGRADV